jgi:U4/U6 small nuclear ribonucleoprotein PRP31
VILALGNGSELQGDITGILPSGSVMAVKVTAATSKGETLPEDEWSQVTRACEMMFGLDKVKKQILEYVESRISLLAPNISAIVGTQTATKILGIAGGLQGLNRIPHSNIYVSCSSLALRRGCSTMIDVKRALRRYSEPLKEPTLDSRQLLTLKIVFTRDSSITVLSCNKLVPKIV